MGNAAEGGRPCPEQGRCGRPARPTAADRPRLAEAPGSLRHALALREASRAPAGRGLRQLVFLLFPDPPNQTLSLLFLPYHGTISTPSQ
eukprot:scaffold106975_cov39-Phaeocystis_antarctica.AAC.1